MDELSSIEGIKNPDEIAKNLHKRQKPPFLLKDSQEAIEAQNRELLQLKLTNHELVNKNKELRRLLDQREGGQQKTDFEKPKVHKELKDTACQTNLDSSNIDDLLKASITLKRQKEQTNNNKMSTHQNLMPYEKKVLEELFELDGVMTRLRDKLKAKV